MDIVICVPFLVRTCGIYRLCGLNDLMDSAKILIKDRRISKKAVCKIKFFIKKSMKLSGDKRKP